MEGDHIDRSFIDSFDDSHDTRSKYSGDPLFLQNSDHQCMTLVNSVLTGNNLAWNRSIKIALGVEIKLGFINGKDPCPSEDSPDYEQWIRIKCMVTSWILNSITKDIVEFLYIPTAKELWDELQERFDESNEHLIYQLQREINTISQKDLTISIFYEA